MSQIIDERSEKVIQAIDYAEKSLVNYRSLILENDERTEVEAAPFHHRWSDELLFGTKNKAIQGFRGCAKTNYVMRTYPQHRLMFPNKDVNYIVFVKQNTNQARKALKAVSREYQSNKIASANLVEIYEDSGEVFHVKVLNREGEEMEVRLEAYGKGQALRGASWVDKRPDIVIIDDPQDREDARSETILENDWDWFLSDIKFLGAEAGSRIFFIGNNLGEKSLSERIMNNPEEVNFDVERLPRLLSDGKCAWESRDKPEDIEALKASYSKLGKLDIFYEEVLCVSVSDESRIFLEEDYVYYSPQSVNRLAQSLNVCAVLDPASSVRKESCYRAIDVVGVDERNNWFILEILYGRWDSVETLEKIFQTVKKWKLRSFGIEKGHYEQVIKPFMVQKMGKENCFFAVKPLEHGKIGTKLERIKMLQPRFKAHSVYLPEQAPFIDGQGDWLAELKSELAGVTKDAIKSAYIDLVDALAMIEQVASAPHGMMDDEFIEQYGEIEPMGKLF